MQVALSSPELQTDPVWQVDCHSLVFGMVVLLTPWLLSALCCLSSGVCSEVACWEPDERGVVVWGSCPQNSLASFVLQQSLILSPIPPSSLQRKALEVEGRDHEASVSLSSAHYPLCQLPHFGAVEHYFRLFLSVEQVVKCLGGLRWYYCHFSLFEGVDCSMVVLLIS